PPVANNDSYGVNKNSSVTISAPGVLGNDSDLDGNPMTAVLITGPAHGTLSMSNNGGLTHSPASNSFAGDSFPYQFNDGVTNSGAPTSIPTDTLPICPPVANNDSYGVNKNSSVTISAPGVLANDSDLDGNPMTAVLITGPAHGTLSLSTNGGFTYTPGSNYFGAVSFTSQVNECMTTFR